MKNFPLLKSIKILSATLCGVVFPAAQSHAQQGSDWVDGDLVTFIEDGAWCWFQDERAVVDVARKKLIIGSTNQQASVDLVIYDLSGKRVESKWTSPPMKYADDHNSPGLLVLPNGNYLALWAHHYDEWNTRYSIHDGTNWSAERLFDWKTIPGGTNYTIAYSNVYLLSAENRIYNFARANDRAPNFIYSGDNGNTWQFGGQLTTNSSSSYNKGYYKYWGNGVDRIDVVLTEQHPRDFTTSVYHGYIQNRKLYNSLGQQADADIYDRGTMPSFSGFTKLFAHNTQVNGVTMGRCWQSDLMRYKDSSIAVLFKCRANNSETDHRNFYARYGGQQWKITYIGKAGGKMYDSEQDYTGLGALSPDNPNRIYISSPHNPGNDNSQAGRREIWRGTTKDNGATWSWEAVTANSSQDNFRPIVPQWEPGKEAVLWFRGTYATAQKFDADIVGVISQPGVDAERGGRMDPNPGFKAHYPMPGTRRIDLSFTVSKASHVTLELFSLHGKKVATLVDAVMSAGSQRVGWETGGLSSGVYRARLVVGGKSRVLVVRVD